MLLRKSKLRNVVISITAILCVYFLILSPMLQVGTKDRASADLLNVGGQNSSVAANRDVLWTDDDISASNAHTLPEDAKELLSNSEYSLYFSDKTAEIALLNKKDGALWLSNPPASADSVAPVDGRAESQIVVGFYDALQNYTEMNSYRDCVSQGTMTYKVEGNRLIVSYSIADDEITENDIPIQISASRMDELLGRMSTADAAAFKACYAKRSIEDADNETFVEAMITKYPAIEKYDIYEIKDTSIRRLTAVYGYLEKIGYTASELEQDDEACNIERVIEEKIKFDIELIYTLDNNGLSAEIDMSKVREPESVAINTISVLEYFGAGTTEDDGYFMVCDGSGSLIRFNNGKVSEPMFEMAVYGHDAAFYEANSSQQNEKYSLPVYGIRNGKNSILVHQTSGESLSSVNARVAGQQDNYNCAYFKLIARQVQTIGISKGKTIVKYEDKPFRGTFKIQYTPISSEQTGYNGMAAEYRKYLLENNLLKKHETKSKTPLQLTFLGAVPYDSSVLGINVTKQYPLTTAEQILEIVDEFEKANVNSFIVGYYGWFNNGISQKQANKIKLVNSLGSKGDFKTLISTLNEKNIDFYPSVSFLNIYEKGNGFSPSNDNIRKISRDLATGYYYNPVNNYRRSDIPAIYQLSSRVLSKFGDGFIKNAAKFNLSAIALEDLGAQLSSDFNNKQPINREESKSYSKELLQKLCGSDIKTAVSNPNLYALPYASAVLDMPIGNSGFRISDQSIPFYQMVVRGYVDCFTKPLNYSADYTTELLNAVEYGVAPSYLLTYSSTSELKGTRFNGYNKSWYKDWMTTIIDDYEKYSGVFDSLQGVAITAHNAFGNGVFETVYENGERVYVNYSQSEVTVNGVEVPARGFVKGAAI